MPLLALTLLAAACASVQSTADEPSGGDDDDAEAGPPQYGGKMTYGLEAENTDGWCLPESQLDISGIQRARSIYDTLTIPDGNGEFQPFLAESVTPNADYTEWTIQLREGIKFHDGSDLDAEIVRDVLSAFRGDYPGRSSLLFSFVLKDIYDRVGGDGRVDGIQATGPLTVKITTTRPWVSLPAALYSSGRVGIIARAQLEDTETCDRNLIGTGPFELEEWQVNRRMRLTRNENYWRTDDNGNQLPYLDELEYRPIIEASQRVNALRSGEIDAFHLSTITGSLVLEEMRGLDQAEQVNLIEEPDDFMEVGFLMLNSTKPPFDHPKAREAVQLAVDRDLFNEIFTKGIGKPANGPFAPGSIGYVEDTGYRSSDPERARQLVREYEEETGENFEFIINLTPDTELLKQVNFSKEFFQDAGMTVRTNVLEQSALIQAAINREYQMQTFRNYPGEDPDQLYVWWHGGEEPNPEGNASNPVNFPAFYDEEVNDLLDRGRETPDREERAQIYQELNRELNKEHYFVWTTWAVWFTPMDPDFHNIVGTRPPDDAGPDYPGLALGNDMALVWKEQ